ncbi:GrpB-like predicted nucleotidyltransferase (UPF0157 family) [Rhizobium sp. BK212]|nr:GrpB-like predicted nucleotidyltransferase (UPF0157 family) [Rhizobium sp. BK212]
MAVTSKISIYDSRWPSMFPAEKQRIAGCFEGDVPLFHQRPNTTLGV